jgi:hypothetical protein
MLLKICRDSPLEPAYSLNSSRKNCATIIFVFALSFSSKIEIDGELNKIEVESVRRRRLGVLMKAAFEEQFDKVTF